MRSLWFFWTQTPALFNVYYSLGYNLRHFSNPGHFDKRGKMNYEEEKYVNYEAILLFASFKMCLQINKVEKK